jgi:hypothetical protein
MCVGRACKAVVFDVPPQESQFVTPRSRALFSTKKQKEHTKKMNISTWMLCLLRACS